MPSPEKPDAKPAEAMEVEERPKYVLPPDDEDDEAIMEEVDLPALPTARPKLEQSASEEEPYKMEVMLPQRPSKGAESNEAGELAGETSLSSKSGSSSQSSKSSETLKARDMGHASVSPKTPQSPESEDGSGLGKSSRSRKKSKTPQKGKKSPQESTSGKGSASSPVTPETSKLFCISETGSRLSPTPRPKSPRSPIKELVEGIGRVGRMMREHSPRSLKDMFSKSKKERHGSEDEDQPLVGGGTPKASKCGKSKKKDKKKDKKKKKASKDDVDEYKKYVTTETPLLESDTESDATHSTDVTHSSTSEKKAKNDLPGVPEIEIEEGSELMDTSDDQQSLSESEPESPRMTTRPSPEEDVEECAGESSNDQPVTEAAESIPGEEKPKSGRRKSIDFNLCDPSDEAHESPSKRSKTK